MQRQPIVRFEADNTESTLHPLVRVLLILVAIFWLRVRVLSSIDYVGPRAYV